MVVSSYSGATVVLGELGAVLWRGEASRRELGRASG